jgi:membrane fusion protein (multidrug efflux system)
MLEVLARMRARLSPRQWRLTLLALGPAALLLIAGVSMLTGGHTASTNNAYLKAGKVGISADVAGRVIASSVVENARVQKGDILFQIDPAPFEIAVAKSEADLASAKAALVALQARYAELGAQLESAKVDSMLAERAYERQVRLQQTHVASDQTRDAALQARAKAEQNIAAIGEQRAAVLAELDGDTTQPVEVMSRYKAAQATLDQAKFDLSHAKIVAPSEGLISQTDNFRPGLYVRPGEVLFSLVQSDVIWVEANMKETDVTDIRMGQPARIRVDAFPGRTWDAEVDSLSAGTGSEFALLPPQNATGNWVKVTQRVPVRLKLKRNADDPPLRIGMSAQVEIDTRDTTPTAAEKTLAGGTTASQLR